MSWKIEPEGAIFEASTGDDWVNSSLEDEADNKLDNEAPANDDEKQQEQKNAADKGDNKGDPIAKKNVEENSAEKMEEELAMLRTMKEKFVLLKSMFTSAEQNQLLFSGPVKRSRIELTISNCVELFAKPNFKIYSTRITLFGFDFHLNAQTNCSDNQEKWLGLFLRAQPPSNYKGPYSVHVNCTFRITNKLCQNDVRTVMDLEYNLKDSFSSWGRTQIVKLETLLDRANGFITEDGKIYVDVEFKIKSITMGHMLG